MEILKKLGFESYDDFKYQLEQDSPAVMEVKELLLDLSIGDLKEKGITISSKRKLIDYARIDIGRSNKEHFKVVFLDCDNKVLAEKTMFSGTISRCSVYLREILKEAFKYPTRGIIFIHNHPSGNVKPSETDINITKLAKEVFSSLDITVLEHIIISRYENYYSMFENGDI